ncbi:unnamed protein product [Discula destructiva]
MAGIHTAICITVHDSGSLNKYPASHQYRYEALNNIEEAVSAAVAAMDLVAQDRSAPTQDAIAHVCDPSGHAATGCTMSPAAAYETIGIAHLCAANETLEESD